MDKKHQPLTEAVYYILLSLQTPLHGYGIMQNIKYMTGGRVKIGAGTLYGAINTLLKKNLISEFKLDPYKKDYIITEQGKEVLRQELFRLRELVSNGEKILEGK